MTTKNPVMFNGGRLIHDGNDTVSVPKDQGDRIELIDINSPSYKVDYLAQHAQGAYIASICMPQASYDLSVAVQYQDPSEAEIKLLNKRLQWQIDNKQKGIRFDHMELKNAGLFVLVDGSSANNKNLRSQIDFVPVLAIESKQGSVINGYHVMVLLASWRTAYLDHDIFRVTITTID